MQTQTLAAKSLSLTTGFHFMFTGKLIHFHARNALVTQEIVKKGEYFLVSEIGTHSLVNGSFQEHQNYGIPWNT